TCSASGTTGSSTPLAGLTANRRGTHHSRIIDRTRNASRAVDGLKLLPSSSDGLSRRATHRATSSLSIALRATLPHSGKTWLSSRPLYFHQVDGLIRVLDSSHFSATSANLTFATTGSV